MSDSTEIKTWGWDIPASQFGPRGVIARPERSATGNIILRVGTAFPGDNGWEQTVHVVLTPTEARQFLHALTTEVLES
jgi:hypothetical protein